VVKSISTKGERARSSRIQARDFDYQKRELAGVMRDHGREPRIRCDEKGGPSDATIKAGMGNQ